MVPHVGQLLPVCSIAIKVACDYGKSWMTIETDGKTATLDNGKSNGSRNREQ